MITKRIAAPRAWRRIMTGPARVANPLVSPTMATKREEAIRAANARQGVLLCEQMILMNLDWRQRAIRQLPLYLF